MAESRDCLRRRRRNELFFSTSFFCALLNLASLLLTPPPAFAQAPAAQAPAAPPPPSPVEVANVKTENLAIELSAVGSLLANEALMIRPEFSARIAEINFKEGDAVNSGEKLVSFEAGEYRAHVDESAATVKLKQVSYNRAKQLRERNLVSQQEYDQEASQLDQAHAQLALNEERLRKMVIKAPFSGTTGLRKVSVGDYVKEGADIVQLSDISAMKLDFQVPETYLRELKEGLQVTIQTDAYPNETFTGHVFAIAPGLDVATRTVMLRARIPNTDHRLRPGMFARVKLKLSQHNNALLVPEESIWPIGKDKFVYRIVDNKAALTKVTLGYRRYGEVEVLNGLASSDTVVTAGQTKIRDGASVKVINAAAPTTPPPSK